MRRRNLLKAAGEGLLPINLQQANYRTLKPNSDKETRLDLGSTRTITGLTSPSGW
nr:hypothetical protein [Kibdelosporangium sp. MJ126-NF4]CEL20040.1 hypothetical protein [Kibdelosporangium sp. MJ126-NF4]CTQ97264.1 hypothetical protein [Kibdelosporangium sp. MJ126-NF4]